MRNEQIIVGILPTKEKRTDDNFYTFKQRGTNRLWFMNMLSNKEKRIDDSSHYFQTKRNEQMVAGVLSNKGKQTKTKSKQNPDDQKAHPVPCNE